MTFLKTLVVVAGSIVLASFVLATAGSTWFHGFSQRAVSAAVDAFIVLTIFSMPATLFVGLPVAALLPRSLAAFVGLVVGTGNGLLQGWLDDYFTGPGISGTWIIYGALHGVMIGFFAYLICRLVDLNRST